MEELNRRENVTLNLVLEATELGTWDYDPVSGALNWDARCKAIFGLPPDAEVKFESFIAKLSPDTRPVVTEKIKKALEGENDGFYTVQYKFFRESDKTIRWIKSSGRVFFNDKKEPIRFIGAIQDITDITNAKEELLETQNELRRKTEILSAINDISKKISAELDPKKAVQLITDSATAITGAQFGAYFYNEYNEEGGKYMLFTHSGIGLDKFKTYPMPRNTKIFGPTFRGERIVRYDDVTKQKDFGKNAPYFGLPKDHPPVRSYLAVPVIAKNGEVMGGLFFGHSKTGMFTKEAEEIVAGIAAQASITLENAVLYEKMKKAHAESNEQRELMYKIFEDAPAIIIITRGPNHVFEFSNEKARKVFGDSIKIGSDSGHLRNSKEYGEFIKILDSIFATGNPVSLNEVPINLGGLSPELKQETRYFNAHYFPLLDRKGKVDGIIRYGIDITEQVKARQTVENFLSIASHELKTPITTIMAYLELIQEEKEQEERNLYLNRLERGAHRLNKLVSDLLDTTRINKGKIVYKFEMIDIDSIVEDCVNNIPHTKVGQKILVHGKSNSKINGDKARIEQVLYNLLVNALNYSDREVEVILRSNDSQVFIDVKDYGIGIPEDKMDMLFKQFSMIEGRRTGGLGLGLYIAKGIVEEHGGKIMVKSKVGEGSVFSVALPL